MYKNKKAHYIFCLRHVYPRRHELNFKFTRCEVTLWFGDAEGNVSIRAVSDAPSYGRPTGCERVIKHNGGRRFLMVAEHGFVKYRLPFTIGKGRVRKNKS